MSDEIRSDLGLILEELRSVEMTDSDDEGLATVHIDNANLLIQNAFNRGYLIGFSEGMREALINTERYGDSYELKKS